MSHGHPYDKLTPEVILDAVECLPVRCTGGLLALNSYENRVYRVDTETRGPLAVKFYRPGRWDDAQIAEEHTFTRELAEQEIPVVAPLSGPDGATLLRYAGFRYAVFPWQPGRASELGSGEERRMLGRFLGRLHRVGASASFHSRPRLNVETFGREPVRYLLEHGFLPDYLAEAYRSLASQLLERIAGVMDAVAMRSLRLHGDCHLGNLLWTETGPHIVDFDDSRSGPAVQDLWMLLSGDRESMQQQLGDVLEGYTGFMDFDAAELALIEPLRTLRLMHYSAWLARRWDDPAFPRSFPWFNTPRYWEEHVLTLREQQASMDEAPLTWG
ncbi:MAG: serine/threonine protein kinase [Gammaproteobacteria bacterium]|nr:serine/threonine protein kinase [Gammaproteobacteria bacterium]